MTKTELRREMRRRLGEIAEDTSEKSQAVTGFISAQTAWGKLDTVALYSALPGEPDLTGLWKKKARRFCYPRIDAGVMVFCEVASAAELRASSWHPKILEPVADPSRLVAPEEIDLILVPGLAFTRSGQRLGRGGGFYDRYLTGVSASTAKVGVCFECQIVTDVPSEAHDQQVDAVVTEREITGQIWPRPARIKLP